MEIDFCAHVGDSAYADDDPGVWPAVLSEARLSSLDTRAACEETKPRLAQPSARSRETSSDTSREAHEVPLADDCGVVDAVTQSGPGELWLTAQIVVS
jgi:hypothetical protein